MQPSDREQFARMVGTLSEYYGKQLTPSIIEVYWQGLEHFELQDIRRAFNLHVANADTGQFMPKIADVVKFIEGNKDTAAMEAWGKVRKAIQNHGTYQTVVFDDKIIHSVIADMGGWPQIGMITDQELPFKIKEFERRYQGYLLRGVTETPPLLGLFDSENSKQGFERQEAKRIGNFIEKKQIAQGNR